MTVEDIEGEGFNLGLACCEVLNGAGGDGVVPGDHAAETRAGRVGGDAGSDGAERTSAGGHRADGVAVGQLGIRERQRAAVSQVTAGGDKFEHTTGDISSRDDRFIVGAGDRDNNCLSVTCTCRRVILGPDGVGENKSLSNSQEIEGRSSSRIKGPREVVYITNVGSNGPTGDGHHRLEFTAAQRADAAERTACRDGQNRCDDRIGNI